MWIFPWIKLSWHSCCMETNLNYLTDSRNFSVRGYLPLIRTVSVTHIHGLAVYMKQGLPFAQDLSLENSAESYLCFWLALLHSVSYLFFFYQSRYVSLCTAFDSDGTDRPGEFCYILKGPYSDDKRSYSDPWLCLSLSCSFEFLFSGASICVLQWISLQWEIQIMLYQFLVSPHRPSKSDYSCADWDGLRDHFRDVPWEDIFKLRAFAAANYESFKVWIDVYIIVSIRSSDTHLHGFQLPELLPQFI